MSTSPSFRAYLIGLGALVGVGVLAFGLLRVAARRNPSLTVHGGTGAALFAESVTVAPGTSLFFTWGVTPSPRAKAIARGETKSETDRYGDTYAQARALMTQLTEDLREAGLTLRDVIAVRANLVAEPELDMAGWNKAFSEFFGTATNPHKPARTTIGISRLFHPDYRAEVEFVAAIPPQRGPFATGTRFARFYDRLHRTETTNRVRSYGRPTWALSTGKAIAGGTSLYFQSAMFPDPMTPAMAAMPLKMRMFKGDVETQAGMIFKKQVAALTEAGLTPRDAFFSRNILYPNPKSGGRLDFAGFNKAYNEVYNNPDNPNRLARTVMSAPGYASQGQLLAIETYAAYPNYNDELFGPAGVGAKPAPLKVFGDPKAIAATGVATSPAAALTWVSGLIAGERGDMKTEAAAVFAIAKQRLAVIGGNLSNVVQLRAYVAAGANALVSASDFEAAYTGAFADAPKPALTILPVKALANDAKVEVELLAATVP